MHNKMATMEVMLSCIVGMQLIGCKVTVLVPPDFGNSVASYVIMHYTQSRSDLIPFRRSW